MLKNIVGVILCLAGILGGISYTESQTVMNQNISSNQSDMKARAAPPDQCISPGSSPAGPAPIPHPNIPTSSDASKGSKKVKVDGQEIIIKDTRDKKASGDEEGTSGTGGPQQMRPK
jgi:hypothetical protein